MEIVKIATEIKRKKPFLSVYEEEDKLFSIVA